MNLKDILAMSFQNLMRRKGRTLLTVMGVVIGCCSVVIMISIGFGVQESQNKMLKNMGDLTTITVYSGGGFAGGPAANSGKKTETKLDDEMIKQFNLIKGVDVVTPKYSMQFITETTAGINDRYKANWITIMGVEKTAIPKMGYQLLSGSAELKHQFDVLVGNNTAYNFSDTLRPEGHNMIDRWSSGTYDPKTGQLTNVPDPYFDITKSPLTIVVSENEESQKFKFVLNPVGQLKENYSAGYETSEGVIMSLEDMKFIINKVQGINRKKITYDNVIVKAKDIKDVVPIEKEIKQLGFSTSSMEQIRTQLENQARQTQLMLGGLGGISLFVAAIGITNTMIMSITERTREIGIMKALGCFVADIRKIFLTEAAVIGLLGGVIGSVISFVVSLFTNVISSGNMSWQGIWSVITVDPNINRVSVIPFWLYLFAIAFAMLIGLVSGYYPANKAVQISALEAIRNE